MTRWSFFPFEPSELRARVEALLGLRRLSSYRALVQRAPLGVVILDRDGVIREWNPEAEGICGYRKEDLLGKPMPWGRWEIVELLYRAKGGEAFRGVEIECERQERSCRVELTLEPFPGFVAGFFRDVTERRRTEEALRRSEKLFRTLAESTATSIFMHQGGCFTYVNHSFEDLSGYSRQELLQMPFWEVVHPEHRDMVRERGLKRLRGEPVPERYEIKVLCKDGAVKWVELTAAVIDLDGKPTVLGTAYDVTERKELNMELERRVQERTSELLSATKDMETLIYSVSHDLRAPSGPSRAFRRSCSVVTGTFSPRRGFIIWKMWFRPQGGWAR